MVPTSVSGDSTVSDVSCTIVSILRVSRCSDLPKLAGVMKPLSKSDPAVLCCAEESGEHIIASSGELHLEICLQDLQQDFNGETCQAKTSTCLAKSADKRNHLFLEADTIGEELSNASELIMVISILVMTLRSKVVSWLMTSDGMSLKLIRYGHGPEGTGPNLFVDTTEG